MTHLPRRGSARRRAKKIALHAAVGLYTEIARPLMRAKGFRADTCILGTRVAIQVMKRLGFPAYAVKTRASVYNPQFVARVEREGGRFPRDKDESLAWYEEDGAHMIAIDTTPTAKGYPGHLVAIVGGTFLLDSALDQFSENSKWLDYEVPGASAFFLPPEVKWTVASYGLPGGGAVVYERLPEVDWTDAPDWTFDEKTGLFSDIVNVLVQAVRFEAKGRSFEIVSHDPRRREVIP